MTRPGPARYLQRSLTKTERKHVWTTFSEDQVDLNFKNPEVLLKMIDILLFYLEKALHLFA